MMSKTNTILSLRKRILNSIKRPDFLSSIINSMTINDLAWNHCYLILFAGLDCVSKSILTDKQIDAIIDEIDGAACDLENTIDPKTLLYCWVWLHSNMIDWVDVAIELEEYETAENLRKVITKIYNENIILNNEGL